MEVPTYRSDGSELILDVPENIARTVGYFATVDSHLSLDPEAQRPEIDIRPYQVESLVAIDEKRSPGVNDSRATA